MKHLVICVLQFVIILLNFKYTSPPSIMTSRFNLSLHSKLFPRFSSLLRVLRPFLLPRVCDYSTGSHLAQWGNCPHCGQKYSNQSALKYHVRLVHSDLTNRLCCYLCPRAFTHRDSFKKHMWERHNVRV